MIILDDQTLTLNNPDLNTIYKDHIGNSVKHSTDEEDTSNSEVPKCHGHL